MGWQAGAGAPALSAGGSCAPPRWNPIRGPLPGCGGVQAPGDARRLHTSRTHLVARVPTRLYPLAPGRWGRRPPPRDHQGIALPTRLEDRHQGGEALGGAAHAIACAKSPPCTHVGGEGGGGEGQIPTPARRNPYTFVELYRQRGAPPFLVAGWRAHRPRAGSPSSTGTQPTGHPPLGRPRCGPADQQIGTPPRRRLPPAAVPRCARRPPHLPGRPCGRLRGASVRPHGPHTVRPRAPPRANKITAPSAHPRHPHPASQSRLGKGAPSSPFSILRGRHGSSGRHLMNAGRAVIVTFGSNSHRGPVALPDRPSAHRTGARRVWGGPSFAYRAALRARDTTGRHHPRGALSRLSRAATARRVSRHCDVSW